MRIDEAEPATEGGSDLDVSYIAVGDELEVFSAAWRERLPVLLKGPTGCGKTCLVEQMARRAGVPLITVACHEDMTGADLLGRYVLRGGATEWVDGPLTRAVRGGGICYLDEVVEARQDTTVVIHSLTDHRRELFLERRGGERLVAVDDFQLVVSYNPGYQSLLKDLKPSTRQRMVAIELGFPPPEIERRIVSGQTGLEAGAVELLVRIALAIRRLDRPGLREAASTRTLVTAARLIVAGLPFRDAVRAAVILPLADDPELINGLMTLVDAHAPGT